MIKDASRLFLQSTNTARPTGLPSNVLECCILSSRYLSITLPAMEAEKPSLQRQLASEENKQHNP